MRCSSWVWVSSLSAVWVGCLSTATVGDAPGRQDSGEEMVAPDVMAMPDVTAECGTPMLETCNNRDDDCNGRVDDLAPRACSTGVCATGHIACVAGAEQCVADGFLPATAVCRPSSSACDAPEYCTGSTAACPAEVPTVRPCYGGPAGTSGVGACRSGMEVCTAGAWSGMCAGEVRPTTETCDNVDNNCNGAVDEGVARACYTGPAGTAGVGICRNGTQTCSAGAWGATCSGQVTPRAETCNALDDDCDGVVDDGVCP
jgi:hypothetical protein